MHMRRRAATMSTIGVRELARHASSIINDIEKKKEPAHRGELERAATTLA
jgi:hypothetical protein